MSATPRFSSLSPESERWLHELSEGLPDEFKDLQNPDALQEQQEEQQEESVDQDVDPFLAKLKHIHKPDNLEDDIDTPFSEDDANFVERATEEQTPPAQASSEVFARPKRSKRTSASTPATKRIRKSHPGVSEIRRAPQDVADSREREDDPYGYATLYDDFDALKSDDLPPQTGEWAEGEALRSPEEKRGLRLLKKSALERLRRARAKRAKQLYTELRF